MIRKIIGLGRYSAVVALPKELLRKLGWRKGQKVVITSKGKTLQVKDARSKR